MKTEGGDRATLDMLISETEQFVFLHNPKAAGTSVRTALAPWETRNNHFWGIVHDEASGWNVDKAHLPLHVLSRLYPDERQLLEKYFTFGFCRHPLRRFISAFNERFKGIFQGIQSGQISTDEYCAKLNAYARDVVSGGQWNPNFTHATPQKPIFFDGRKCVADLIIRVESPWPQVGALQRLLGPPGAAVAECFNPDAKKENARPLQAGPEELLSPSTLEMLSEFYADDFLYLGYALGEGD